MKFIALSPLFSTQSALGDVAEVKDAVGFAELADIAHAPIAFARRHEGRVCFSLLRDGRNAIKLSVIRGEAIDLFGGDVMGYILTCPLLFLCTRRCCRNPSCAGQVERWP
jgi:hypothetical protein